MGKLTSVVQPYLHETAVGAKFSEVQEMMDVLYQCEDVRDHINELAELAIRASGFMGTGFAAEEKVENAMDHAKLCSDTYQKMLDKHPDFKPKIEQTVGHGLAILRSKHKFKWSTMHRSSTEPRAPSSTGASRSVFSSFCSFIAMLVVQG